MAVSPHQAFTLRHAVSLLEAVINVRRRQVHLPVYQGKSSHFAADVI
jgi:hypothetical protein